MAGITASERAYFRDTARAAFSNPFSTERDQLDRMLADAPDNGEVSDLVARAVQRVASRLDRLSPEDVHGLGSEEAGDIENARLFVHFHRAAADLDAFIDAQLDGSTRPAPRHVRGPLSALVRGGFSEARAVRAIELFYQMRRAFRFIRDGLIGNAPSMHALREALWNQIFTSDVLRYERHLWNRMEDFGCLLVGETGSGKGAAAAALGRSGFIAFDPSRSTFSTRFDALFVAVNLSEFSEGLLESELFGHKRGAFTGAVDAHEGVLARCLPHGVIFLDEVGELAEQTQVKLLRVLQERTYSPVGSHEARRFEGRVVAATHRAVGVRDANDHGPQRLRDDFYYRLASDVIELPTLRRRLAEDPNELAVLVGHIVARLVGEPDPKLANDVLTAVVRDVPSRYAWPGNVRELEQTVRRVLLTGKAPFGAALSGAAAPGGGRDNTRSVVGSDRTAAEVLALHCAALYAEYGTYEKVARITGLDRRTAKKYIASVAG